MRIELHGRKVFRFSKVIRRLEIVGECIIHPVDCQINEAVRYGRYVEWLKRFLIRNDFFLPDFRGHISHSFWAYCHVIAKFCRRPSLKEPFLSHIEAIRAENSGNPTVISRCEGLIDKCEGITC